MKQARQVFTFFVVSLCFIANAHAGEYFVAVDGADSNPGSWRQPLSTVQKAADLMKPGDTCYVRGGVYRQVVSAKRSGTAAKPAEFARYSQ